MKYKVGDKVRVRKDLSMDECYGLYLPISDMCELAGKVVTIVDTHGAGRNSYTVAEQISGNHWWTDEMFEGLAEDTKFKVGDRVIASDNINKYHEAPGTIIEINERYGNPYLVRFDKGGVLWSSIHRLIEEAPTPTPEPTPVININVTINNYDNACWYCRKGGLVDLYLEGAMGICPNCKRVCNDTRKGFTLTNSKVIEFTAPKRSKRPKRKNEPLTTEELYQMDGKLVWCSSLHGGCTERFNNDYCGWFKINVTEERISHVDNDTAYPFKVNGVEYGFRAYLEEPEQAKVPKPECELPF